MAPVVDMSDKHAWDDSLLISSWDDALNEYKKYHSIHQSGKRLEDVLTEEEVKELREGYGDLIEETEPTSGATETNGITPNDDADMSNAEISCVAQSEKTCLVQQEPGQSEQQNTHDTQSPRAEAASAPGAAETLAEAVPQAMLGTVKDENLKNIMMSWYYAGYYTGLHAGQQQQAAHDSSAQE
ncbi:hypothetical protein COCCADRAFT_112406 [Bipolaris zeicola 26-R-13]|uniref:Survival Motor Neuron Gemin2-binding domain-containing protein n=1 Tax=Cochliobolus carbonum (strain 26-R-13) TaxID=930089 RepID=W6Y788_COCC2|nr:uncharacterized protein COCCADRAFT_112406 [Bipolaris zeicola 26-R-13]EUC27161.1 hypothetical protein COCCADRAFT_112406 [Bipolaris zeicola 26-R-13]